MSWLELLKDYDMSIVYQQGEANVVADSLSRIQREYHPCGGRNEGVR